MSTGQDKSLSHDVTLFPDYLLNIVCIAFTDFQQDGGGYGAGQGNMDLSSIINMNNNDFIGVAIQYRVSQGFDWMITTMC